MNFSKKHFYQQLTIGITVALCTSSVAKLRGPFRLDTPKMLPKGVTSARLVSLAQSADRGYDADGVTQSLGQGLSKPVPWLSIINGQKSEAQKRQLQGTLNALGIDQQGIAGTVSGSINTRVLATLPSLAYGFSNKFTLGLVVPVVKVDVDVNTDFQPSSQGARFLSTLCRRSPTQCENLKTQLRSATSAQLAALGYEPLQSYSVSGLGDMRLIGKYNWFHSADSDLTSRIEFTVPTGTSPNPDRLIDFTTGDNRFKVGAKLMYEKELISNTRFHVLGAYIAHLPNSMEKRIPTSATQVASAEKERLNRKLRHQAQARALASYSWRSTGLSFAGGYDVQFLSATRYSGGDAAKAARYSILESLDPDQSLQNLIFSVNFSSVDFYRAKQFFLPMQFKFVYSRPIDGKNVPRSDVFGAELVVFL